jgi:ribulose-phosphate 3-epimerase
VYSGVRDAVRPVAHAIAAARGGHLDSKKKPTFAGPEIRGEHVDRNDVSTNERKSPVISPSLLASDWANIKGEVERCVDAGTTRLHVDIFDGVFLDSPYALTFGPQMVKAIRKCSDEAILDLHMCVERPARYVAPMKEAGGNTFIFQWEAMQNIDEALHLVRTVVESGMDCGISINPSTAVDEILPILESGLVAVVDIMAVEPGFGGQKFQDVASEKIQKLIRFRAANEDISFDIMVDGGINDKTAAKAGADILVAGSFLFNHPESFTKGANALISSAIKGVGPMKV